MLIGGVELRGSLGLAPMAGYADSAFRALCVGFGAGYAVTEMISAKALCYGDKKTAELCSISKAEHAVPIALQIFGAEPNICAEGAKIALEMSGADIIDINMGCPAKKITSNGEGSALMRTPKIAAAVVEAVAAAVAVPVTVKLRSGWDDAERNAPELAAILASVGAKAICIHGRTQSQGYRGRADRELMRRVVEAAGVPVIANGDVASLQDAEELLRFTGAGYALAGRGALGRPWMFSPEAEPSPAERLETAFAHARAACELKGERRAMPEMRAHMAFYLKGMRGAAAVRNASAHISTLAALRRLLDGLEADMND